MCVGTKINVKLFYFHCLTNPVYSMSVSSEDVGIESVSSKDVGIESVSSKDVGIEGSTS